MTAIKIFKTNPVPAVINIMSGSVTLSYLTILRVANTTNTINKFQISTILEIAPITSAR